jgi:polar amino acid transport system substrate-binding protein
MRRSLCVAAAATILAPKARATGPIRVSVAEFPGPLITPAIVDALRIAFAALPDLSVEFMTLPFARSMASVAAGRADLHVPIIRPPSMVGLDWAATAATVYRVPFVIYTNKAAPIDLHNLGQYRIETDVAHVRYFDIPVTGGASTESSLRKVDSGRIDGYIFAGNATDPLVEDLGLKNIRRDFYKIFDVCGVLPKDGGGGPIDRLLTAAMQAVHGDPQFQSAIRTVLSGYRGDWQP